jgi:hypothetical protein
MEPSSLPQCPRREAKVGLGRRRLQWHPVAGSLFEATYILLRNSKFLIWPTGRHSCSWATTTPASLCNPLQVVSLVEVENPFVTSKTAIAMEMNGNESYAWANN